MRRLMVAVGILPSLILVTNCKPRQLPEDQAALRDVQLADLATLESFVAFKYGDQYEIKKCSKSATPGQVDQEAAKRYDAACKAKRSKEPNALSRFECNEPTPYPPIPAPLYEATLKQFLQVENYENLNSAAGTAQQEAVAMRRQLEAAKEMVKELSGAEASEVAAELEKGKKLVEQLEQALNVKEIEVQKVTNNHTRFKNLLATLDCGSEARKVYPTQDYLYLIRPFVGGRYETKAFNLPVEQTLAENQPFKHKTTFTVTDDMVVGGMDLQIDATHRYPSEIGVKITSPSGASKQMNAWTLTRPGTRFSAASGSGQMSFGSAAPGAESVGHWFLGQPARGTWTVEFGDSGSDTGTVHNIIVRLYPQASPTDKRQDVRAWFSMQAQTPIPDNSTLFVPIYLYNSAQQKNLSATVTFKHTHLHEVTATLIDPTGKQMPMIRSERGDGFSLNVANGLSGAVGGTWYFAIRDSSSSDAGNVTGLSLEINR